MWIYIQPVCAQVWDTAGQEAFRKVVTSIYRNIQAVLVVFDPHDRATFESAQRLWLPEVKEFAAPNAIKMLVISNHLFTFTTKISSSRMHEISSRDWLGLFLKQLSRASCCLASC